MLFACSLGCRAGLALFAGLVAVGLFLTVRFVWVADCAQVCWWVVVVCFDLVVVWFVYCFNSVVGFRFFVF